MDGTTDSTVASFGSRSNKEITPQKKNALRVCSTCQDYKPQNAFPKRQWEKKNRRCFFCLAGSVPFSYNPKTNNENIDENIAPTSDGGTTSKHGTSPNMPQLPIAYPCTPPQLNATVSSEVSEEAFTEVFESERAIDMGNNLYAASTGNGNVRAGNSNEEWVENQGNDTHEEAHVVEPTVSLEEDIEDLARNWCPAVPQSSSLTGEPPAMSAPPELHEDSNSSAGRRPFSWRELLLMFASPILDESGSAKSVLSGLFTLFLVGSLMGVASKKNPSLPSEWYQYLSAMVGYTYFLCWSISFYPQVISNYKRKTTRGLSADFCALNVVGFGCYAAYNASLFWSPAIRELYRKKYGSDVTVQSNDVAFAIHALLLSSITMAQISYYRGSDRPSVLILAVIILVLTSCAVYPVLILYNFFSWLDYLYLLSYVKIGISLIKYVPQVVLNHRRKSTIGWSIWNILLDFTGGILSDLQLILDCSDMRDFSGITGNPAKFGLGFVSVVFDIIFMVQHYLLYPDTTRRSLRGDHGRAETEPLLSVEGEQEVNGENTTVV